MTGNLYSFTSYKSVAGINYYMDGEDKPTYQELVKVAMNNLTLYERRSLMYPYLVRSGELPYVIGYFDVFNIIKIFVPKLCKRITVVGLDGNEMSDVEGVFLDPADPNAMLEYNIDKIITITNEALGSDITKYFIDLHTNYLLDAHREEIEIIPGHIQDKSLVNVYLTKLSLRNRTAEGLGGTMWSNDESLWHMGDKLNEADNDKQLSIYPTGIKAFSSFIKDDFSIDYLGDSISGDDKIYLDTENVDDYYRRWAREEGPENAKLNNPKKHIIWGRFKWRPNV